jgi:putrescine transport system ATP-binding protein
MPDAAQPILTVRGLNKAYGPTPVLNDVALDVPRGSIVALLGASGSGKTTLLQTIAGLVEPDSGSLVLDGQDITLVPAFKRPINMMFQSYALFPHLSVAANIEYGLRARGSPRPERESLVGWALELVRLQGLGSRKPDQLSGGQRQRVALARCLVMKPAILLLDEPMAALDRGLRAAVQRELIGIQRKVSATFIVVTHDQDEAMAMADYIAVMDTGRIVQFGPPREVYERPSTRFVASFLGTINLFDGTASAVEPTRFTLQTNDGITLTATGRAPASAGACLGIRPEKLVVARAATGLANDFVGTIEELSYCGNVTHAVVRLAADRRLTTIILNHGVVSAEIFAVGDTVHVGFAPESLVALPE